MLKIFTSAAALASASLVPYPSAAAWAAGEETGGSGQVNITVAGHVPLICKAVFDATMIEPVAGTPSQGTLKEFCNSPTGYRVVATYSPELVNSSLIVDGRTIALDSSGQVTVSQSSQPGVLYRQVALVPAPGAVNGWLSFRVEPL